MKVELYGLDEMQNIKVFAKPENIQQALNSLLDGASFDGGHHKQYYIMQALECLIGKQAIHQLLGDVDEGIPA